MSTDDIRLTAQYLKQWSSTWSRWTCGGPPGISSGPQRNPQIFVENCYVYCRFFFKENVRYPMWTCRDPISL